MRRVSAGWAWLVTGVAAAALAGPEALLPPGWSDGVHWEPQQVRVADPEAVRPFDPYVPALAGEASGEVSVSARRAAVVWLGPLEVLRVRALSGTPRFQRVPRVDDPHSAWVRLEEAGVPAQEGLWYLAEPMGPGSLWLITAEAGAQVRIERPGPPPRGLSGEAVRAGLLAWIDGTAQRPALPLHPELRHQLDRDLELARLLEAQGGPELGAAVRAWRKASALRGWELLQPLTAATWRLVTHLPRGASTPVEGGEPLSRPPTGNGRWELSLEGPGLLSVEVRRLFHHPSEPEVAVEILEDRRPLAATTVRARPSFAELEGLPLPLGRTRRTGGGGLQLGPQEELRIPLAPGRHTYRIEWRGGAVALRAREAHRRPWLHEKVAGEGDWSQWAQRALRGVAHSTAPAAVLLHRELARLDPRLDGPATPVPVETLSPALRPVAAIGAVSFGAAPDRTWEALAQLLEEAGLPQQGALAWALRLELADQLISAGRFEQARRLMGESGAFPPSGWLAASAARRVARLPVTAGGRSRELAALELGWRMEPLSPSLRAEYSRRFHDGARWRSLPARGPKQAPRSQRWLDITTPEPGERAGSSAFSLLPPGQLFPLEVSGEDAPRLLRLFVLGGAGSQAPLAIRVGALRFELPPVEALEPVELALPAGRHTVAFEGPANGPRAFAALGERVAAQVAYARTHWALQAGGHPVRFRIPDGQLPTPVRLQLRQGKALRAPTTLWLRTDVGVARRLVLMPGTASAAHRDLDSGGAPSFGAASFTLPLPPQVREVWLEGAEEAELFASVAVRWNDAPAAARPQAPADPALAEQVLALSRALHARPDDAGLLLERAGVLLSAGEEGLAGMDLERALEGSAPLDALQTLAAMELQESMDRESDERLSFPQPLSAPTLLRPALGVVEPAQRARYLAARALLREQRTAQAALALAALYRDLDLPQLGLEALALMERSHAGEEGWRPELAPIGHGLARRLTGWAELSWVRRLRRETARWTRWERLADAEQQAGSVFAEQEAPAPEAAQAFRQALLAPPWALSEGRVVRAGDAAVLELSAEEPQRLGAQVLCRTWPTVREASPGPCRVTLRVDGKVVEERKVPHGAQLELRATLRAPGAHQLELMLEDDPQPRVVLVRFVRIPASGDPVPLRLRRPLSYLRSSPSLPVRVTVMGPTTLRLGARSLSPGAAQVLRVTRSRQEGESTLELPLPAGVDPSVSGAPGPVGEESETWLLLPEEGAHHLRLESGGGEVLVRMRTAAADRPDPQLPLAFRELRITEPLPWPALPERLALLPGDSRPPGGSGWGTLSFELGVRDERFSEEEEVERPLRTGAEAQASLRREWVPERWWIRAAASSRMQLEGAPAFGAEASVHGRGLPAGLRLTLSADAAYQSLAGTARWRLGGRARVDRFLSLTPDLALVPSLTLDLRDLGGTGEGDRYDLSVFSRYGARHPWRLIPRASLRWQPFQDQLGALAAWTSTNSDLRSLDQVSGEVRWSSLWTAPLSPLRTGVGYGVSYRLEDAHRRTAYLRHQLRVDADWTVWSSPGSRLLLFAEDRVFFSTPFGLQNLIGAGVRWDFGPGRGLRDLAPGEEEFDHLLDPVRSVQ